MHMRFALPCQATHLLVAGLLATAPLWANAQLARPGAITPAPGSVLNPQRALAACQVSVEVTSDRDEEGACCGRIGMTSKMSPLPAPLAYGGVSVVQSIAAGSGVVAHLNYDVLNLERLAPATAKLVRVTQANVGVYTEPLGEPGFQPDERLRVTSLSVAYQADTRHASWFGSVDMAAPLDWRVTDTGPIGSNRGRAAGKSSAAAAGAKPASAAAPAEWTLWLRIKGLYTLQDGSQVKGRSDALCKLPVRYVTTVRTGVVKPASAKPQP